MTNAKYVIESFLVLQIGGKTAIVSLRIPASILLWGKNLFIVFILVLAIAA